MADKLQYFSDVKDGLLQANIRKLIKDELPRFEGKRVEVVIQKAKKQRSDPQNRFYWGVIIKEQQQCFLERWGELVDAEQVHDWNKANIWYEEKINEHTGEVFKIPGSSKKQSTFQFEERLEKLRQFFWNSFDWKLSLPNEAKQIDFKD